VSECKARAVRGEAVEVGRLRRAAVAGERVGSKRIYRDEQNVLIGTGGQQRKRLTPRPPQDGAYGDQRCDTD